MIPKFLYKKLTETFNVESIIDLFGNSEVTLYGECCGEKIQKYGENYIKGDCKFILFDVFINNFWLHQESVSEIAYSLCIDHAPCLFTGNLSDAIDLVKSSNFKSGFGDFTSEGLILRPKLGLKTRMGHRIITKVKCCNLAVNS